MNKLFQGNCTLKVADCDETEADIFKCSLFVGPILLKGEIIHQYMIIIFPEKLQH
jgi:hypothetical protein